MDGETCVTLWYLMMAGSPNFITSWTVKRHIVVKKVQSQLPDWLDTAWKSLFGVIFKDSTSKTLDRQYLNSHIVHCIFSCIKTVKDNSQNLETLPAATH